MILPGNYDRLSDEQLLQELLKTYDKDAAEYIIEVVRGKVQPPQPLK